MLWLSQLDHQQPGVSGYSGSQRAQDKRAALDHQTNKTKHTHTHNSDIFSATDPNQLLTRVSVVPPVGFDEPGEDIVAEMRGGSALAWMRKEKRIGRKQTWKQNMKKIERKRGSTLVDKTSRASGAICCQRCIIVYNLPRTCGAT